ncbi:hypothetical protein V8C35DRAFT_310963 [Trichoderma chlorosporum]
MHQVALYYLEMQYKSAFVHPYTKCLGISLIISHLAWRRERCNHNAGTKQLACYLPRTVVVTVIRLLFVAALNHCLARSIAIMLKEDVMTSVMEGNCAADVARNMAA